MNEKLTPQQIENWRKAMFSVFGPYALIMPEEGIQKLRDKIQERYGPREIISELKPEEIK